MNKNDVIDSMAEISGLNKIDALRALEAFEETVTIALCNNNSVRLIGFGTFTVAKRAATTVINPRTKQIAQIPARKVAKFKAGKYLLDAVNEQKTGKD